MVLVPGLCDGDDIACEEVQCDNSMRIDMAQKRGKLIGKLNSLQQEFYYVEP